MRLFRELFRGREDVFPTRFESRKTGKAGYAPACANKFVRGICGLPTTKCGECPNQAFVPVDDQAVLEHLRGRHVIAAGVARKMGCYLITETMARRHQLSMESYDRLFPNQDTTPREGFGNLIALPLQYDARKHGNTVFLDASLEPYPDQWGSLASVPRVDTARVEAIAGEATRRGKVVGVRLAEPMDDWHATPWTRPPSQTARATPIPGPLPKEVRAVLAQRLFVDKEGLPSPLLDQVKRLAAFQNPEFYKKQMMRLSTAVTPRVIARAEEFPQHIALPRGCRDAVKDLLQGCIKRPLEVNAGTGFPGLSSLPPPLALDGTGGGFQPHAVVHC